MTANPTAADQPFTIVLDDDETNPAEGRLRKIDAGPTWAKHRVRVELAEADTSGHALDATSVSISLRFDDDVEGHALSLHFPTAKRADDFRKRLLATGIVAGALVVGVTAAQLSGTVPATNINPIVAPAPIAAPAPRVVQPKVNPNIPAEDLAPAAATAAESPAERIRDLAPSAATAAESPAERIREQSAPAAAPAAESPAERIRELAPSAATAAESPAERIREQSAPAAAPAAESPAERIRVQDQTPAAESPAERIRDEQSAPAAAEPPAERNRH